MHRETVHKNQVWRPRLPPSPAGPAGCLPDELRRIADTDLFKVFKRCLKTTFLKNIILCRYGSYRVQ